MATRRKYPAGIQSFERIRRDGYVYVDKTEVIYKMITEGVPYFLSRPRRFGKSLLISTLAAIFEGRRELFEAFTTEDGIQQPQLFIASTNWKWRTHPVLRFDFSKCEEYTIEGMKSQIANTLSQYEKQYGITPTTNDRSIRLENIILEAERQSGQRVVMLIDEYDTVMLHNLGDPAKERAVRECFLGTFGLIKALDNHLQLVFITGISKFSQMGIFSRLNNLTNISMVPDYDTICGISEEELTTAMHEDIEALGEANGIGYDEQLAELKQMYDGYHFSRRKTDIYNPFSLVNVFNTKEIGNYWFDRGTSSALIATLAQMPPIDATLLEGVRLPSTSFDLPLENFDDPIPFLYQSGYLTVKNYQHDRRMYTLGFPNGEVRTGFADCLFQHVTHSTANQNRSVFLNAYYDFRDTGDLPAFIEAIRTFFAGVPYQLAQDNQNEHYYHSLLYTLLMAFGADVVAEEPTAKGRADITLRMPRGIYVMELKYDKPADDALAQIDEPGYAEKYRLDGRPVTKVGISFSSEERNIAEWKATLGRG
ncbi:MAG: ATP-binding protein [Prevotella sp.]|nr:ATP-binding protein [Prevotella sp.]